ncbi:MULTISPECIES: hypothetical protein [Nonomuraea]|uniref:Uncharacterized protein n=1 Tax=Nonomuraea salmonea TaxID=46181 RepID=A0ABV5NY55_9ACTN
MKLDGVVYSKAQLRRIATGTGALAGITSRTTTRYTTVKNAVHVALTDDEYGRSYWEARGPQLENIGVGLGLLADALSKQESGLAVALRNYRAGDDASTLPT